MAASAASTPLVARSNDGSLIAIHHHDQSTASNNGLIRCCDGNVSKTTAGGSLLASSRDVKDGKKRKSAESVAPAPGEQGREASRAADLTLGEDRKKARVPREGDEEVADAEADGVGSGADGVIVGHLLLHLRGYDQNASKAGVLL